MALSFRHFTRYCNNSAYNPKYEVVFSGDKIVENRKGEYLSRFTKKNGKYRYYLTREYETFDCSCCGKTGCCSQYCRGGLDYYYYFDSSFIGTELDKAIEFVETQL